jgi:hypothetical protein
MLEQVRAHLADKPVGFTPDILFFVPVPLFHSRHQNPVFMDVGGRLFRVLDGTSSSWRHRSPKTGCEGRTGSITISGTGGGVGGCTGSGDSVSGGLSM